MRKLRLVGLSADGRELVLVDEAGAEYAVPADDRLRAALRGDRARLGQLEIQMDSALRPRDIQARVRAGASPESVATLAQVPVEKIMSFCVPVLAEREHVAELARRCHIRRRGQDGPARTLGDLVAERLRSRGVEVASAEWDAWRRDDGRWAIETSYHSGESERSARFVFDAVGRYSLADDDEARWLTGERQSTSKGPQPREAGQGRERRLSAVPDDDLLSLGDEDTSDDLTAVVRAVREVPAADDETLDTPDDEGPALAAEEEHDVEEESAEERRSFLDEALSRHVPAPADEGDSQEDGRPELTRPPQSPADAPTEPTPGRRPRRSKRASVPSWDEIMLGPGGGDDDS